MVGYYFDRRRGVAAGVAYAGAGFGLLTLAPLSAALVAEYSWKGALVVLAGVSLNCLVFGALMRPLPPASTVVTLVVDVEDVITPMRVGTLESCVPLKFEYNTHDFYQKLRSGRRDTYNTCKLKRQNFPKQFHCMIPAICKRIFSSNSHYITAWTLSWNVLIAHCTRRRAALSETFATILLSTGINRCGVQSRETVRRSHAAAAVVWLPRSD